MAISGDDYALLAADTRHLTGFTINSRYSPKVYDIGDNLLLGAAGCDGDAKAVVKRVRQRIEWYHHTHNKPMSVSACARMIQGMLYSKRFFPYYAYVIVSGLDENGECEFWVDSDPQVWVLSIPLTPLAAMSVSSRVLPALQPPWLCHFSTIKSPSRTSACPGRRNRNSVSRSRWTARSSLREMVSTRLFFRVKLTSPSVYFCGRAAY